MTSKLQNVLNRFKRAIIGNIRSRLDHLEIPNLGSKETGSLNLIDDGNFGLFVDPLKAMDNSVSQKAVSPYIYLLQFQTKMSFSIHSMIFYQKL